MDYDTSPLLSKSRIPEKGFGILIFCNYDKMPVKRLAEQITSEYIASLY